MLKNRHCPLTTIVDNEFYINLLHLVHFSTSRGIDRSNSNGVCLGRCLIVTVFYQFLFLKVLDSVAVCDVCF